MAIFYANQYLLAMKKLTMRWVVLCIFVFCTNLLHSANYNSSSFIFFDQEQQNEWEKEQEAQNTERNDEAVETLDEIIKNLEAKKEDDKVEALKAMRDYIKRNRKKDTGTTLDKAADEAKETTAQKDNKKSIKEYIDKIHSALAKKVFDLNFAATGTGRTTGHIADLSISNNSDEFFVLTPQLLYVPGRNGYQGYIVFIPDVVTIGPGTVVVIPVHGYCADPHVPPVPDEEDMPQPSQWVPIDLTPSSGFGLDGNPPMIPEPMNPPGGSAGPPQHTISVYVSDQATVPGFDPGMIGDISTSPGYTKDDEGEDDSEITATWPGTDQEIGGTMDPDKDLETFAQLAGTAVTFIIEANDTIQNSGLYTTPFSNDKEREKEAIIQQTFWIFMALLIGEDYEEEDFKENIYTQFQEATGIKIEDAPAAQKESVDSGATDFWTVYKAVGVEAKVFGVETEAVPISNPEKNQPPPEKERDCCVSEYACFFNPQLDFDMKIADQWADARERRRIIASARESMENEIDLDDDEVFQEFDINRNPTSATSFWKPGTVGGFASAYAKTWFKDANGDWEWVWGTEKLNTDASGNMTCTLSYDPGEDCRAVVAGTSLIRIRASSSAFDAMAGNRQDEDDEDQLAFLRTTKYGAEKALEWLVLRGRGRTNQSFRDHVRDDLRDKIEGEITSAIESEVQDLADEYLGEYLEALGLSAEDLSLDNLELPDLEESLEELLGIDIPTIGDLEATISEGIEATLNLFFVSNTYAKADGYLVVNVGGNNGSVRAHTSVRYGRQSAERTSEAMSWTGAECKQSIISDVKPNALSISTEGYVNMVGHAASKFGFGNGSAKAYLESMNLQMFAGLCVYEEEDGTTKFNVDVIGHLSWYSDSDEHQESLKNALSQLEADIKKNLEKDIEAFQQTQGSNLRETRSYETLEGYTDQMLRDALEEEVSTWAENNTYYWQDCTND